MQAISPIKILPVKTAPTAENASRIRARMVVFLCADLIVECAKRKRADQSTYHGEAGQGGAESDVITEADSKCGQHLCKACQENEEEHGYVTQNECGGT